MERVQFGRRIGSFQAIRHRLAETHVAIEGAEATLHAASDTPDDPDDSGTLACLLAKAATGQAARIDWPGMPEQRCGPIDLLRLAQL
ncbi:hypothetical protein ABH37_02570 [Mycobacterium haemophilum]|uniref:Acyl-CoA dehydrogenase/oxidase C-terminal domain-containing protein n=1 Tax=Mycobacterium haemophilum TaxID=29311 RepID=A0A0I9TJ86_9MYCO|nr:hypothetical protein ABH39_11530 [Mycobacterium haemophilum]KLO38501.1 hypothetical protein ABH38_03680 [Mycobacterium haemophilum]KLO44835.1 hypothetical protein ABH37_02570 [Mycobacterium haemophilum]KLO56178.1 hypothetical protein ABH36_02555 [Mycobacterium haemophilum]